MIPDVPTGGRGRSGPSRLWSIGLLLYLMTATGCPRMVSLDYQPNNRSKRRHGRDCAVPLSSLG